MSACVLHCRRLNPVVAKAMCLDRDVSIDGEVVVVPAVVFR